MSSRRENALADLIERLGFIQTAKGYGSDAGLYLFQGEVSNLGPDDPPAGIAIIVGADSPVMSGSRVRATVPVEIQALVPANLQNGFLAAETILSDIKKAVEGPDIVEPPKPSRSLLGTLPMGLSRGSTRWLKREPGATTVGIAIEYLLAFEEPWGEP
jgi:hypothetical protein